MIKPSLEEKGWKTAILVALVSTPFAAALAAYCPLYVDQMVEPFFDSQEIAIEAQITAVDESLSTTLKIQSERLLSALAVLTKQKALAASQIAEANRISMQNLATGMKTIENNQRLTAARFEYGGEFGQGFNPCKVVAQRQMISGIVGAASETSRERVTSEITAAPGKYGNSLDALIDQLETNRKYCTQEQFDSGMCENVGELAGANTTVASLFTPSQETDDLYDAKLAFINNLVGLPTGEISSDAAQSLDTQAYVHQKSQVDALVSPALYSLKSLQMDYTGFQGGHIAAPVPVAVMYEEEVARYIGDGEEHVDWTRKLAAQNERGLLVELLRVSSLELSIMGREYEQGERREALLANLLAIELKRSDIASEAQESGYAAARPTL